MAHFEELRDFFFFNKTWLSLVFTADIYRTDTANLLFILVLVYYHFTERIEKWVHTAAALTVSEFEV